MSHRLGCKCRVERVRAAVECQTMLLRLVVVKNRCRARVFCEKYLCIWTKPKCGSVASC